MRGMKRTTPPLPPKNAAVREFGEIILIKFFEEQVNRWWKVETDLLLNQYLEVSEEKWALEK